MNQTGMGGGVEFDLIRSILARYGDVAEGVGDDAGAVRVPGGETLYASTDVSVENVHFRAEWISPDAIGYRAAMAALSDLAAMAATPRAMLVTLVLPDAWRNETDAIAGGLARAARDLSAPIVGGDVSRGDALAVSVTVLGSTARPLLRSGAKPRDSVWVTGRLGGPGLALDALRRGLQPDRLHMQRFAAPRARIREALWLEAHGASAAVDISDGLAADLGHLAAASGVQVVLDLDRVPVVNGASPEVAAASGEEYELAVAVPHALDAAAFESAFGLPLTCVGTVDAVHSAGAGGASVGAPGTQGRDGVRVIRSGAAVAPPAGFDHFAR